MNKKPNIEKLISIIDKWKINKTLLAKSIGITQATFAKKISPNLTEYNFTEDESVLIAKYLKSFSDDLRKTVGSYSRKGNYYFEPKKFQNSLKKSEGVVSQESRKKKEFAGGTLIATGKNNPDSFRSFNLNNVVIDCDENGNPVTIKPQ